jgi:sugar phosphate isomerase/epimerase
MERREFLQRSVIGAAAIGLVVRPESAVLQAWAAEGEGQEEPKKEAVLKLGSQEGRIPGGSLREKVLKLEEWGGVGLEIGGAPADRIQEIRDALKGTRVRVSALCWGSCNGDLVSPDATKRARGLEALRQALNVAGELESTGVIFVPCFHGQSDLKPEELDKILLDLLPALGEYAQKCKTRVLLEPLNKGETFYLNRLEQAAAICNKINNPGVCMMGDFYHMGKEEKNDREAFVTAGKWLHHVHLASRARVLPGQDDRSFVEGFRGLKQIVYRDYCSLECGIKADTNPEEEIPKAFRFLEQQWKEATL